VCLCSHVHLHYVLVFFNADETKQPIYCVLWKVSWPADDDCLSCSGLNGKGDLVECCGSGILLEINLLIRKSFSASVSRHRLTAAAVDEQRLEDNVAYS